MTDKKETPPSKAGETKDTLEQSTPKSLPQNTVTVEKIGPSRVRIKIEIPVERIEARLDNDLDELLRNADVPGFRVGRAPRRLIEKRFGSDARERLKYSLVGEAVEGALEEHKIKTIGEPQLDIEAIEMPEEGSLCFEMETEIEPEFELPELEGIAVSKSAVSVEDKDVEATIKSMLAREGVYEPISKGSAEKGDQIVGDLWLKVGDEEITRRDGMALMAGPSELALMTVELNDLCENFVGAKTGSQVTAKVTIGDKHAKEEARGKEGVAGMDIKEIKRLKIPPLTDEWLKKAGWKNQDEFRSVIKENLQRRVDDQVNDGMRMQIREYLLSQTTLELPENLSAGQIEQAQNRRIVELMQMGIPEPQARTAVDSKSEETTKKALDDTKAFFILRRIGEDYGIEVDEGEINGQIAAMARNYGMRPEKMRQQLSESGQLTTMNNQIREVKVLDKLLSQAKISEAEPEKKVAKKKATTKKTAKKKVAKSGEAPKAQAKKKKKAPDK